MKPRRISVRILLCIFALSGAALLLAWQSHTPGPQVATFYSPIDNTDQPYGLYLPKSFDRTKRYPLVISLHGAYSNHRLDLRRLFGRGTIYGESASVLARRFPTFPDVDFIAAVPNARGTMGYQGLPEEDVYQLLDELKRNYPIDEDRVYLTGLSLGGGGALWLGLTRPDVWAAIAAVCPAVPVDASELAANALNVPIHLFHGDQDTTVPVTESRTWNKRFLDAGVQTEYTEYPGVRHNAWDYAYKDARIFPWFAKFKRNRYPDRVHFSTRHMKYRSAYWVTIDDFSKSDLATINAEYLAKGSLRVTTQNITAFTIDLTNHPQASAVRTWKVAIDGAALAPRAAKQLSFLKTAKGWQLAKSAAEAPSLEGPIAETFNRRFVVVYGPQHRDWAQQAVDWGAKQQTLDISPILVPDTELKAEDLASSNLLLIGSHATNTVLAKLAPKLPLELNTSAADYGLFFVTVENDRYIAVNSGLPWYTGLETARRPGLKWLTPPWRAMLSFGDYILFKGSLDHVIAEGRFTRQWSLPLADAQKLTSTGAVSVR